MCDAAGVPGTQHLWVADGAGKQREMKAPPRRPWPIAKSCPLTELGYRFYWYSRIPGTVFISGLSMIYTPMPELQLHATA